MADQETVLSAVLYYAREGCYRHMQTTMEDLLVRFGSDSILLFWKAFGMILEDRLVEGMRELTMIQDSPDLILAAPLLLIHAHRQCKTIDKEAIQQLEAAVKKDRKSCSNKAFYYASMVHWLTGRHDRAREYLDKCLRTSPSAKALALRGWIDLTCDKDEYVKKSIKYFDEAYNSDSTPPLNAVLGKVQYHTSSYLYMQALDIVNSALVNSPSCLPLYLEKMRIQLALREWDVAIETAQRCIALDSTCIKATQVMALEQCIRYGNMDEVASILGKLIEQLDQSEPQSHQLYLISAQAFSRLSGGHKLILQQTHTLLERAINLCPSSPTYIVELAYQYMLSGNIQEAMSTYRKVLSLSDSNMSALLGVVHCKLKLNKTKESEQQLEFLNELQGSIKTPELLYLDALTTHQKGKDPARVIKLINEAVKMHFDSVKGYPLGLEYFYLLNPEFIMSMVQILLKYAPSEPSPFMRQSLELIRDIGTAIDPLAHSAPGLLHVRLLLARVKYISGDPDSALSMAQLCVDRCYCVIEALILQALVHLQRGRYKQCDQTLESALSNNFEVQQYPLYQLVKGQQQFISSGLEKECIKTFQLALSLKKSSPGDLLPPPTAGQWVSGHLSLAKSLATINQEHEATKIMQDCVNEFTGTPEEARVNIANAEFLLNRGNSTEAIAMLRKVTEDKIYYIQAMEHMAEIYLIHQRNKQKYIQCYQELADKLPGPPTALLLGDALMIIEEPEQALLIYEKALKKNPTDGVLASKVGQIYIRTHNYNKAVSYYEASLKSIDHPRLRCDLALLYMKLNRFDQAERILSLALDKRRRGEDDNIHSMRDNVRYCQLLTKLYRKTKRLDDVISVLERERGIQAKILKRVSVEEPDAVQREKELLSTLLHQLADEISRGDPQNSSKAEPYYKEAAESCPENTMFRESLAHWYMSCGRLEECEQECMTLLRTDSDNDVATGILAELSFVKGKIDDAVKTLEELLKRKPTYYEGLTRLIDLLRRAGNLEKAESYLKLSEDHTARFGYEAGLNYCKGLYHRYKGDSDKALLLFNRARRDSDWGEKAGFNMVEISLNFDDVLGAESLKGSDSDISTGGSASEKLDYEIVAANIAEKLLRDIHPNTPASSLKVKVMENYILMVTRAKQNVEKALANFTEMPSHDRESIPSLVGMAVAYLILKQVPRARNHLKRLGKTPWVAQYADELEKGWILLADLYIQTGKHDLAVEQLKKCLQFNKSCSKAYEYLGFIAEKEQAYGDAVNHYRSAWLSGHMTNPAVGYRLAFNLLKGRLYLSCIDVCHEVLENYPNYPRIRKEILEKARQSIRI